MNFQNKAGQTGTKPELWNEDETSGKISKHFCVKGCFQFVEQAVCYAETLESIMSFHIFSFNVTGKGPHV